MIGLYGMSESIGLAHVGQKQNPFLPALQDGMIQRDCSEQTAREIDQEVKKLLSEAYESAKSILSSHRDELERVVRELLNRESLDEQAFNAILGRQAPVPAIDPSRRSEDSGNGAPVSDPF
jgi:cell division protease FtsH